MRISDWSSDVCSSDLGCGAHVAELRRLWVDPFREPRLWTLEALQALAERGERGLDACLLPVESGMASWPEVEVDAAQAARLSQGQGVAGGFHTPGAVAIFDPEIGRAACRERVCKYV